MMFLIDHLYFQHPENSEIQWSYVLLPNKNVFLFLVHWLQSLAVWNTWDLFSNFWPRPASFSKCTSFQHLHQSWKPRRPLSTNLINLALKKFQCNQTWKRIFFYVIAQFLKHVNQARNIEHSQFLLLCYNAFHNLSIQK